MGEWIGYVRDSRGRWGVRREDGVIASQRRGMLRLEVGAAVEYVPADEVPADVVARLGSLYERACRDAGFEPAACGVERS